MDTERLRSVDTPVAAEILGLDRETLEAYRRTGKGPRFFKYGGGKRAAVRYRVADLLEWQERCSRVSTSDPGPAATARGSR